MLSFFPLDVLDEIRDLIEPGSEGFLTYSLRKKLNVFFISDYHTLYGLSNGRNYIHL